MNLTPSEILKIHNIKASKKLGQHFLNSFEPVEKIVRAALPLKDEFVLEIGPGLGVLTRELLQQPIHKLVCVEYDERCVQYLHSTLSFENEKLCVLHEDALKLDEEQLIENRQKLVIISNLPYNISTRLLFKWLKKITMIKKMILVFQKEVGEKICARRNTKDYGILSVLSQFLCVTELKGEIPSTAFFPQPKVDSAIVSIVPRNDLENRIPLYEKLQLLCKTVFNQRRKTLRNSIAPILENPEQGLSSINIDSSRRPESLSIEEFELIVKKLKFV